ncbi:MAG: hypothetical protein IMY87_08745 [Chloroflexi bacterium]|nr:hypothetical protein [Chloroflexota bacterium]
MVPFFSRRSITVLLLGVIVGALLGLGYWYISPIETKMGWPPISFEAPPDQYESTMIIEVMPPGADYMYLKSLQREGEYYAAKMSSSSFLKFLSETELGRQYYHTPEELAEMLRPRYEYGSDMPLMTLRVTSSDKNEAYYLAGVVPEVFKDYLAAQERDAQLKEYQNIVAEFDSVGEALVEARTERDRLAALAGVDLSAVGPLGLDHLGLNLDYVIADAEVRALERVLDNLTADLVSYSTNGIDELDVLSRLNIGDPSDPTSVPPDKVRGRNALVMGAVFGLAIAWLGLNRKELINRMRPAPATTVRREEEEEDEEEPEK